MFIGCLSVIGITEAVDTHPLSFSLIHWFFTYVFFFISPVVRLNFELLPLIQLSLQPEYLIYQTNNLVIIWSIFFYIGYWLVKRKRLIFSIDYPLINTKRFQVFNWGVLLFGFFIVMILIVIDPFALISRSGGIGVYAGGNILSRMFIYFFRPLFLFLLLIYLFKKKVFKKNNPQLVFQGGLILITFLLFNIPTGTARFYAFTVWITIIFCIFFSRLTKGYLATFILFFGLIGAEFLTQFRSLKSLDQASADVSVNVEYFGSMNFDAYEILASSILYVERYNFTLGENILGAFLFFVPRPVWPTKPISTGSMILRDYYSANNPFGNFENVSSPLISEFYIAFGVIGIILGALLIASICSCFDNNYLYLSTTKDYHFQSYKIFFFPFVGLFLFTLRGSLMVAFSFIFGFIVAYYLASILNNFSVRIGMKKIYRVPNNLDKT